MAETIVEWREAPQALWRTHECDEDAMSDGEEMACWLIRDRLAYDPANWGDYDGVVEIRAPEKFAGEYEITIDYEPEISATKL